MGKRSRLLLDTNREIPLLPELAVLIGDRPAIALQQIHYWLDINEQADRAETHFSEEKWWCYNTWADWREKNFPFWSKNTVWRTFDFLEKHGLIITRPHDNDKKGKWYTIDYGRLNVLLKGEIDFENYPTQNGEGNYDPQNGEGNEPHPAQNGEGTGDPESTSSESSKTTRPPSASGLGTAPRGKQPKTGDTKTAASDEEPKPEFTPLIRKILVIIDRRSMSPAQMEKLKREVINWNDDKAPNYPSPHDLFEQNEDFRAYVELRVKRLRERSEGKIAMGALVDAVCDYHRPKVGWIAYMANEGILPDMGEDWEGEVNESPQDDVPIRGGVVKGRTLYDND